MSVSPIMTTADYLSERLEEQQKFFSLTSRKNKKKYYFLKTSSIILASLIPFLTGLLKENLYCLKYVIGVLGVLLAVMNGLEVFFKFHERWLSSRSTSEALKQEKFLYLTRSGPYNSNQDVQLLAERVENLLSGETLEWRNTFKGESKKNV